MRAKREPLQLEVVHADEPGDARAFLRLYIAALLDEVRRDPAEAIVEEALEHETLTITIDGRERPRIGLFQFLSA